MDVKTWSKDQTKNRDDEVVDLPAASGWQPAPPNRFRRSVGVAIRILLAWLSLEVTGLRYAIGMSHNALLVGTLITLLIVILRYMHLPIRVGIAALLHGRPTPEMPESVSPEVVEAEPDFTAGSYDQVSVGDDGELVYTPNLETKIKREVL